MIKLDSRDTDVWIGRVEEVNGGGEEKDYGGEKESAAEVTEEGRTTVTAIRS